MSADVTREPTGGQGLRERVGRWLYLNTAPPARYPGEGGRVWLAGDALDAADAVLALPELAALIADADRWRQATTGDPTEPLPLAMQARELLVRNRELEATVARVRELLRAWDQQGINMRGWLIGDLLQALDGEPQP